MVFPSADQIILDDIFVALPGFIKYSTAYLKIESYNPGGSIKMKTAASLLDYAEQHAGLKKSRRVIESSSGNLGVAISLICAVRGYHFTCVVDKNTLPANIKLIEAYGAEVVVINKLDANGGYLGSRLAYIQEKLAPEPGLVWLNQYQSPANPAVHSARTAQSVMTQFPNLDFIFIGAGTTGTLAGCTERLRKDSPDTRIIAVDSVGSVNFGGRPSRRFIPGLGSSVRPHFLREEGIADFLSVAAANTGEMCHRMTREYGLLLGGSSGTVLAALAQYESTIPAGSTVVALSPDSGDRYVDTLYSPDWVDERFPGFYTDQAVA